MNTPSTCTITLVASAGVGPFTIPIPAAVQTLDSSLGIVSDQQGFTALDVLAASVFKRGYFYVNGVAYNANLILSISAQ